MPTIHLLITGHVQGVFYRATAKDIADKTGITGWIKNTADGNVEALINGDESSTAKFIEWCKKGPRKAVVKNVIITPDKETYFNEFLIIRRV